MSDAAAKRRAKQTVNNLALSLIVTVLATALIIMIVPRDDSMQIPRVDYQLEAQNAQEAIGQPLFLPEVDEDWWANSARLETTGGVESWFIGLVTPTDEFIGIKQGFDINPTWLALEMQGNWQSGELELNDRTWQVWEDLTPSQPKETKHYALIYEYGQNAILIYGTATEDAIGSIAAQVDID
ncbi:MAG TPA: DUF4245 domain-containing protein [Microbacteriaceae bacterium]